MQHDSAAGATPSATIYSVAALAGVSIATVSRVLQGSPSTSPASRQAVHRAVQQLGYIPQRAARSLAARHSEALGMVVGDTSGPYYSELLIGFESAAARDGRSVVLMLAHSRPDLAGAVRDLAGRVDSLAIGPGFFPPELIAELARALPVVLLSRDPAAGCDAILTENVTSAALLTNHLFGHGRLDLLFVGDPDGSADVRDRYLGFRQAHRSADVDLRHRPLRVPQTEAAGVSAARTVLARRSGVDGLVCANDELALAATQHLQSAGVRVPDDLAVVGWDDVMAARYVTPSLTTVRQPVAELGERAAIRLAERSAGAELLAAPEVLPTEIRYRASCGCGASEVMRACAKSQVST